MKICFKTDRECSNGEIRINYNKNLWTSWTAQHHKLAIKRLGFVLM